MTQGLGMSFLTRMYNSTGNQTYMQAALDATQLINNVSEGGIAKLQQLFWYEDPTQMQVHMC